MKFQMLLSQCILCEAPILNYVCLPFAHVPYIGTATGPASTQSEITDVLLV